MTEKERQEHTAKEILKKIVDESSNYTPKMKNDNKIIINAGKTPEEICQAVLSYFSMIQWM